MSAAKRKPAKRKPAKRKPAKRKPAKPTKPAAAMTTVALAKAMGVSTKTINHLRRRPGRPGRQ